MNSFTVDVPHRFERRMFRRDIFIFAELLTLFIQLSTGTLWCWRYIAYFDTILFIAPKEYDGIRRIGPDEAYTSW